MSTRRKSTINVNVASRNDKTSSPALELERLEQETTLVLQEIDHNLSRSNAVINDKIFPILTKYAAATSNVWKNVGFWKHFMEEAADVEIKTLVEKTHQPPPEPQSADSSYDKQIEASTPQQQRSRSSFASSQNSARRRLSRSPSKHAEKAAGDARSSIIQNFLDSSPTLPEPPVLMSEVGRMTNASSSSVARPLHANRGDGSSDEHRDLSRLSPISFPSISLTPSVSKPNPHPGSSTQRFPNTPSLRSSLRRRQGAAEASPSRRTPTRYQDSQDDIGFSVLSHLPHLKSQQDDDSDEPSVPELQTINLTRTRPAEPDERVSKKGRFADDPENVFLDSSVNPENHSRSMSQLFEEVLAAGPRDPSENAQEQAEASFQGAEATDGSHPENPEPEESSQHQNLSHSMEQSVNSSELGSFLGERWKSLSSTLRKQ